MSKGKFEKPKPKRFPWLLIVVAIALIAVLALLILKGCDTVPMPNQGNGADTTTATVEKNPDSIAVPGYEMLELKASSKEQSLCKVNLTEERAAYYLRAAELHFPEQYKIIKQNIDEIERRFPAL